MMLSPRVTKNLAPLQNANVYEVSVHCYPKLFTTPWDRCGVPGAIVRSIAQEVHTQNSSASETGAAIHRDNLTPEVKGAALLRRPATEGRDFD